MCCIVAVEGIITFFPSPRYKKGDYMSTNLSSRSEWADAHEMHGDFSENEDCPFCQDTLIAAEMADRAAESLKAQMKAMGFNPLEGI